MSKTDPAKKKSPPKTTATMKKSVVKKAPVKKVAAKKAPVKKAPAKKASAEQLEKKAAVQNTAPEKPVLSLEDRYGKIAEKSYLLAEANGFQGDPTQYWLQAEAFVLKELGAQKQS